CRRPASSSGSGTSTTSGITGGTRFCSRASCGPSGGSSFQSASREDGPARQRMWAAPGATRRLWKPSPTQNTRTMTSYWSGLAGLSIPKRSTPLRRPGRCIEDYRTGARSVGYKGQKTRKPPYRWPYRHKVLLSKLLSWLALRISGVYGNRTHSELCSNPPPVVKTGAPTRGANTPRPGRSRTIRVVVHLTRCYQGKAESRECQAGRAFVTPKKPKTPAEGLATHGRRLGSLQEHPLTSP